MSSLAVAQEQRCPRDYRNSVGSPLGCLSSGVSLVLSPFLPQTPMAQANPQSFPLKLLKLSSIAKRKDLLTVRILLANLGGFMMLGGNQFEL